MNNQRVMERSTIEQVVLETIYRLANMEPPAAGAESDYPGYPLAVRPKGAAIIFYLMWPLFVGICWVLVRR